MKRRNTAPAKAHSSKTAGRDFWEMAGAQGSIAHMLSESPGGIEGALARLQAARADGREPSVAIALGEEAQTRTALRAEFDAIQTKLLTLASHCRLADQRLFGDLEGLPEEYHPAANVLHDATDALEALHNRLDSLGVRMADLFHEPGWRERLKAQMQVIEGGAA